MPEKQPPLTTPQQVDAEREQRVASRDRVDYSYAVFWMKHARLWDIAKREAVAQQLTALIGSPDFDANYYQRTYTLNDVAGAHSGASLLALQKVLKALRKRVRCLHVLENSMSEHKTIQNIPFPRTRESLAVRSARAGLARRHGRHRPFVAECDRVGERRIGGGGAGVAGCAHAGGHAGDAHTHGRFI